MKRGQKLGGMLLLLLSTIPALSTADDRPNILMIVCDDLGYSDIGCYGGEIETPNLDSLASQGMRFSQFYNCAVCVATRAALYTGLYPRFRGSAKGLGGSLRPEMTTLGSVLKEAGYQTGMTGKWHLGSTSPTRPIDRGFDEFYGLLDGCSNFFNPIKPDPDFYNGGRVRHFAHNEEVPDSFPKDYYATDAFTDHAAETLERFSQSDQPFFININYTAPHFPLHALPEDIARYRGNYSEGYDVMRQQRFKNLLDLGILRSETTKLSPSDPKQGTFRYDYEVAQWEDLDKETRAREEARMEVYAAMVDRMDQGLGRLLKALEKSGKADNTIVCFFSDNGGCASWPTGAKESEFLKYNKGIPVGDSRGYEFVGKSWGWAQNAPFRRHKVWNYEGGIATPMIVRWPAKVAPGTITEQAGHVVDLMPTFLELAGGTYPEEREGVAVPPLEGNSILPILLGESRAQPDLGWALYGNYAWREGDRKIVYNGSSEQWELYDLGRDRSETTDLAERNPAEVDRMIGAWKIWAKRCGITKYPAR